VAAAPWLLLSIIETADEESIGNVVMVHHHVRTLAGWAEEIKFVGGIAILGAIAGVVFWLTVVPGARNRTAASPDQLPA
jgi:hypothetical protein